MPNTTNGLFYGGGFDQLWKQAIAAGAVVVYSFVVAYIIAFAIKKTMGIRISPEEEEKGIDTPRPPRRGVRTRTLPEHDSADAGRISTACPRGRLGRVGRRVTS